MLKQQICETGSDFFFKKIVAVILAVTVLASMMAISVHAQGQFVGSKASDIYHEPSCPDAKKINAENKVWFANEQAANVSGYRPCLVCKPPPLPELTSVALIVGFVAVSSVVVLAKKKHVLK